MGCHISGDIVSVVIAASFHHCHSSIFMFTNLLGSVGNGAQFTFTAAIKPKTRHNSSNITYVTKIKCYLLSHPAINIVSIQRISWLSQKAMKQRRRKNYKWCSWDKNGTSKNISPSVSFDSWLPAAYALQNIPSLQSHHLKLRKMDKCIFLEPQSKKKRVKEALTNCTWKEHMDIVAMEVSKSLGIIKKTSSFLNRSSLLILFNAHQNLAISTPSLPTFKKQLVAKLLTRYAWLMHDL